MPTVRIVLRMRSVRSCVVRTMSRRPFCLILSIVFACAFCEANGTQLRRIWIQDFCTNGICQGVHISKNDYVLFSNTVIEQQTRLTFINSTIEKLPHLLFHTFPDLQYLRIENCSLETFERPQFEGASLLMSLYMGNNSIREIPKNIFLGAHNLNLLSLENNRIRTLHNQSFQTLKELTTLSLEGNQIEYLTAAVLSAIRKLEVLNLARNKIASLPEGVFNKNPQLKKIDLSGNQLKHFDSELFKNLHKLGYLDISGNTVQEVNLDIPHLDCFIAADCDLKLFKMLGSVGELVLRNNSLQEIPLHPEGTNSNLTVLDMSYNPLGTLPPNVFRRLPSLARLNLSATNLHDLPDGLFKKQSNLKFLDISTNSLFNLKFSLFDNLKSLEYFYFQSNNWNCDFLQLIMNSFVKRKDIAFLEDDLEPDMVDDFIDGVACWYENNKSSKKCDGGESVLELAIIRNDIKAFVEAVDKKFVRVFRMLDDIRNRI